MVTLATIFQQHAAAYQTTFAHQLLPSHKQVIRAIQQCRTAALGGHVYTCAACHHTVYHYHSCRNRHCPQCQGDKAQQWLSQQQEMLLPTPYFMLTFTLPGELRPLARRQQKLFYQLLFRTSAAATQELAQDPRFLGGQIGLMGVLHTWGRALAYHPHVHFLVPAGCWTGSLWRYGRHQRFFLPVKALSLLFRAKFRVALKQTDCFEQVPTAVWRKDWVVHCLPVGRGSQALKYLAAYVFRVALSNQRLVSCRQDTVSFRFQPSGLKHWQLCSLAPLEFIRRFLQHVLPKGFVKVRYYGFFSPAQRQTLAAVRDFLSPSRTLSASQNEKEAQPGTTHPPPLVCPLCGQPLLLQQIVPRRSQSWQPP